MLPMILKAGVDRLTGGFRLQVVLGWLRLLIGVSLVKGVFQYWMRVIIIGISRDIEYDLRNDLFWSPGRACPRISTRASARATSWRARQTI